MLPSWCDAVDDPLGRQPEPFADRAQDPGVGLVVDEEVDVGEPEAGGGDRLEGRLGHPVDRVAEGLVALHRGHAGPRGWSWIRSAVGAVGAEHDRADPAARGAAHDDRAGAVGEDGGGAAVVGVGDPRHQVGADDQDVGGAAGLDLAAGERERRRRSRCRRR